eukprot:gene5204-5736_t
MYFTRIIFKFDYRNPRILGLARVAFVGYLVLMQLVYLLLRCLILYRKDETILPSSESSFKNPLMSMLGGKSNPLAGLLGSALGGGGGAGGEEKKVKVYEYDSQENYKLYQKLFFEILTTSVMHFVFKRHSSLLIVPLMGIANRLKEPLILIHFFRFKPFGSLARPFKSAMEMAMEDLIVKQEEEQEQTASAETSSEEKPKIENSKETKGRKVKKDKEEEAPLELKEEDDEEMEMVLEEIIEEEEVGEDSDENVEEDEDGEDGSDEQELEELLDSLDAIDPLKKP